MLSWPKLLQLRGRPLDEVGYVLIGTLALLLGTGAIYLNWQQAQRTSLQASQTRQAVGTIRQLLVMLYRGETGQRGFLLTEQQSYLVPYQRAAAQMPEILERLHQLGEQQPAVREAVLEIDRLARAKMGELQTAVELVQEGDAGAAELLVRSNFGKQTMDQLVLKLEELEKRVFISEEQFSAELQEQMRQTAGLTVVCCIALFALFAIENHRVANRKRAAEKASEVKSAFLASMSHELRTPLNVIIGYAQMQQEEAEESGRQADLVDLKRIESAGKHLLVLINQVLELSKIEAGRLEVHPTEFGVDELVGEVSGLLDPLAKRNGNRLVVEVAPDAGRMFSDATRIKQGLLNLASNAAKFTVNGEIRLSVQRVRRQDRDWIDLAVRDTGCGISREDLEKLFEPFSQLETNQRKQEGTGLGLVITRRLCRLLGGDVVVESKVGKGSMFAMQLPAEVTPGYFASRKPVVVSRPAVLLAEAKAVGEEWSELVRQAKELRPGVIQVDLLAAGAEPWALLRALRTDPEVSSIPVVPVCWREGEWGLAADEVVLRPLSSEQLAALILRHGAGEQDEPILVMAPEAETREGLCGTLESMGWRTLGARDVGEGLRKFGEERPGLVLVDWDEGWGFLAALRGRADGWSAAVILLLPPTASAVPWRSRAAEAMAGGSFRLTTMIEKTAAMGGRRIG
jgi:signal transduction histidine kinase